MRWGAILLTTTVGASAAAQPVAIRQVGAVDDWLSAAAAAPAPPACAGLAGRAPPAGRVWVRPGAAGLEIAADPDVNPDTVAFWAEVVLGAREAAEALYGAAPGQARPLMLEAAGGDVLLFDGVSTRRLDPCAALEGAAAALAGAPRPATPGRPAAPPPAAEAPAAVTLRAGGAADVEVAGAGLPPGAVLRGPDGVRAEVVEVAADGALRGRLTAAADAPAGRAALRVYAPDDPFTPVASAPLTLLPGGGAPAAGPVALALNGATEATAPMGGAATLSVTLDAPGALTLRSAGATDLAATLTDADGAVIATNDDAGGGYGFRLRATLQKGDYRLVVRHCCGGGGPLGVLSNFEE